MTLHLLTTVGLLLVFSNAAKAFFLNSSGVAGALCGEGGTTCMMRGAVCDGGECVCKGPDFTNNSSRLVCTRDAEAHSGVVNDPISLGYDGVAVHVPFPCRFGLTFLTTIMLNPDDVNVGKCHVQVRISLAKDIGKLYVFAVDVAIKLQFRGKSNHQVSIRITGYAMDGSYHYEILAKVGKYRKDGPWSDDDPIYLDDETGVGINLFLDHDTNMLCLELEGCGIRINFRHYDLTYRRYQRWLPGVVAAVRLDQGVVRFRGRLVNIGFIPASEGNAISVTDIIPGAPKLTGLIKQWSRSEVDQTSLPNPNPYCPLSMKALEDCATDALFEAAVDACVWVFKAPRFIRCYDDTDPGVEIMEFFTKCIKMYCDENSSVKCSSVIEMIGDRNCTTVEGYEKLDNFIAGKYCP